VDFAFNAPVLHSITRPIDWLRGLEVKILLAVLVVVGGTWGFIELADEVKQGDTQRFDDWAIRALRRADDPAVPIGPEWLHEVGRDLTALGGVAMLSLAITAVAGFLFLQRKYGVLWQVVLASSGALLVSTFTKALFHRERPELVPHLSHVMTTSFPSGHSMLSAAVYLTLGALLARTVTDLRTKWYLLGVPLALTFLVGLSRVYMGVHYPTDVLAGWTAGIVWAVLCWLGARSLQRRGDRVGRE
jgi:undecaprenyl-diphosphatase